MPPTRVIHFSDVHLNIPSPGWRPADFFSKRLTGWLNWNITSRGKRFANAGRQIRAIGDFIRQQKPDGVVFSGDASAIGFGSEATAASKYLGTIDFPRIAVPGNHDYYTPSGVKEQGFEAAFRSWQSGTRNDNATYPFASKIGEIWFVGVKSCRANALFWDAHGRVDCQELTRLDQLLTELPPGRRVLVTHYPYCKSDGGPENRLHGLRNRDELFEIIVRHRVHAWLCGHIHKPFVLESKRERPFVQICGGSGTQQGRASIAEIVFDVDHVMMTRWQWNDNQYVATSPIRYALPVFV